MSGTNRGWPVVVLVADGQEERARAVLTGLEEEGVRAQVVAAPAGDGADALAKDAAERASFDVGVGVAAGGHVALRHARLPAEHLAGAASDADDRRRREVGHDAGRLVRRMPLRHVGSGTGWPHPITTTPPKKENP